MTIVLLLLTMHFRYKVPYPVPVGHPVHVVGRAY